MFDIVIENGLVFDGTGAPAQVANVGLIGGKIAAVSPSPLPGNKRIDATGCWVTPGFIDLHTHYDAEVEIAPSLSESVRHGITTVTLGSCSLSLALGTAEDLADQFCRVEAIPYDVVRPLLEQKKTWNTMPEYFAHLEQLPLGPNVSSFIGHSALRTHVMGMERSLDADARPTAGELAKMEALTREGLDAGYLGVSIQTLPWDKVGGSREFRSRPLPSTFATWSEYRHFTRILRERGRVFQGVPNVSTKWNVAMFLLESIGLFRKALKTTVISMMDVRGSRGLHKLTGFISRVANRLFGADFKWQALPDVFELWADGIDLVVFEEFGAGAAALHLQDDASRGALLTQKKYRGWFKGQWTSKLLPKIFHRNFNHSQILAAPDASLVGKSFAAVAEERGQHPVDCYLDLVAKHGAALRWYTVMANDRPEVLEEIVAHPDVLIGFSDAGAHLRNMAHYNFPLRLLRVVQQALGKGRTVMSPERSVHRLTGELADWLGLDAGHLAEGKRADVVVLDPRRLTEGLDVAVEADLEGFPNFKRMVNQNDGAVRAVFIGGREAVCEGAICPALGKERGFGTVLRATS
jgi:N-acyl-D-aspartate/D-glutamate deacylase